MNSACRQSFTGVKDDAKAFLIRLGTGVKFRELVEESISLLNRICPQWLQRPVHLIVIFILFHLYLLYAIIFAALKSLDLRTKVGGSRVIPILPNFSAWREKIFLFVTSIFIYHWLCTSIVGMSAGWHYLASWIVNLRPQINIKPQVNLITSSESCPSTKSKSTLSISFENMDADVDVIITPKNEELADVVKNVELATKTASIASDLVTSVANSISRSSSVHSILSWQSYSDQEDVDEIDLDEEMEKYNFAESPTDDHEVKFNQSERKTRDQARISLKDVASEVLTKVSVTSSGFRSRIPRPVDMERFNSRNAAANSALRKRFLKRNKSPGYDDGRLFPEDTP